MADNLAENQGELDAADMVHNGFSQDEADSWRGQGLKEMVGHGFSQDEAKKYYGFKEPDAAPMRGLVKSNIAYQKASEEAKPKREPIDADVPQIPAADFMDNIAAGWQSSVASLFASGKKPDLITPENAPFLQKMASHITTLAADSPLMALGATAAAEGGPAASMGAAFAVPAGMRKLLMDQYEEGDIKDSHDFMTRMAAATWESMKQGAVGVLASASGGLAGGVAEGMAGTAGAQTAAQLTAEAATMSTAGAAMEKRMPNWSEFGEAAILMGGFHAVGAIAPKLGNIYRATGERPTEVAAAADTDPSLKQDMLAINPDMPKIEVPSAEEQAAKGLKPFTKEDLGIKEGPEAPPEPEPSKSTLLPADAKNEVLSRLGKEAADGRSYTQKAIDAGVDVKDSLIKSWDNSVDYTQAVGKVLGEQGLKNLPAEENAFKLMNLLPASQQKMSLVMQQGTLDFNTLKVNGEPYAKFKGDYQKEFPDDPQMSDLRAYGMARRRQDLVERGLIRGGDDENDQAVIQAGAEKLQPYMKRWVDFQNKGLKYLADSGVIKQDAYERMTRDGKNYMDAHVIQEADELTGYKAGAKGNALPKKIGDSDLLMKDPIESGLKAWESRIKLAEENRATQAFYNSQMELPEEQRVIRDVTTKSEDLNRMAGTLINKLGIDSADAYTAAAMMNRDRYLLPNQKDVYFEGKRTVFEGDPEVIDALNRMKGDRTAISLWGKMLGPWNSALRMLTVNNPLFALRHSIKNQFQGATYSKTTYTGDFGTQFKTALQGQKPFETWLGALKDIADKGVEGMGMPDHKNVIPWFMKGDDSYVDFVARGGAANWVMPLDKTDVDSELESLNSKVPFMNKAWNVAKDVGSFAHMAITVNDNLIRYREYERLIAAGASPLEAAFQARQVLPDWQKAAFQKSALQVSKAFMKIRMVGMDRMFNELGDPSARYAFVAKNLAYVTSMELLLQAANYGDDRMDDVPFRQKYTHWSTIVDHWRPANSLAEAMQTKDAYPSAARQDKDGNWEVNDGTPWKFPKPFEPGVVFGSGMGALFDTMRTKNPAAMGDFMKEMIGQLALDPMPDAIKPVLEQYMNKNIWTGNAIVKQPMLRLLPEEQSDKYTSDLAKVMGKFVAKVPILRDIGPEGVKLSSPPVIDNYLHDWGGTLGQYAIQAADKGLRAAGIAPPDNRPAATLTEMPFIREFVIKNPSSHPQSVIDFQDQYREADRVYNTLTSLKRKGDFEEYQRIQQQYGGDLLNRLKGFNDTIGNAQKMVVNIDAMPGIPDGQKRQLEQSYYMLMVSAAKRGKQLMNEQAKAGKNTGGGE